MLAKASAALLLQTDHQNGNSFSSINTSPKRLRGSADLGNGKSCSAETGPRHRAAQSYCAIATIYRPTAQKSAPAPLFCCLSPKPIQQPDELGLAQCYA